MTNPEQPIIDDIDALIASELDEHGVPLDDFRRDRYDRCGMCQHHWHGLPNDAGCPGAYATDEQRGAWVAGSAKGGRYVGYALGIHDGIPVQYHVYCDDHGGYLALMMPTGQARDELPELNSDLYSFDQDAATLTIRAFGFDQEVTVMQSMPSLIAPQQDCQYIPMGYMQ